MAKLGIQISQLRAVFVDQVLANVKQRLGELKLEVDDTKEKVYYRIVEYLECEGYPTEADADFKEANVSDLVFSIVPIITDIKRKTGRNIRLTREKEIISKDNTIGRREEFVVVDRIAVAETKFVLI